MLWKHTGHDRPLYIINAVLTCCSMCLSGYFGFIIGEGVFPLNWVLMALCSSVAFGVSMMFERGAVFQSHGLKARAVNCWVVGCLFAAANCMFDYSSAAALRESVAIAASNQNNAASTRKSEVSRIEDRIEKIKSESAWKTPYEAPDTYEATITNLEGNQTIMKRSKNCADQTVDDTKAHCQRIASAKADLANAKRRSDLDKELARLDADLVKAKETSVHTTEKANPAVAQVRAISAWFTGERSLNDATSFWGGNSIMLIMTLLVNCGLVYLGNEIGHVRAAKMLRDEGNEPFSFTAPRLPAPEGYVPPVIPLKAQSPTQSHVPPPHSHSETNYVVINGKAQANSTQTDQLIAMATAALARYENSPFAKTEGRG